MSLELIIPLLVALLSGGVVVKVVEHYLTRNRNNRADWRAEFEALDKRYQAEIARVEARNKAEIERLEAKQRLQEDRILRLEKEANEWEEKYYGELKQRQLLEVALSAKDQVIDTLRHELEKWERSARAVVQTTTLSVSVPTPSEPKEGA